MTLQDLDRLAMGYLHAGITGFYWYNGEYLEGRIVKDGTQQGTFSDNSYYYISHEHYSPDRLETYSSTNLKENGRLILNPNCIDFATMLHMRGNNDQVNHPHRNKIRKLIFIGAGASYDFDSNQPSKKAFPLTNDLYSTLPNQALKYPGLSRFQNDLSIVEDVEAFFQNCWDDLTENYDPSLLADLINMQYHLHEYFFNLSVKHQKHGRSNYQTLANRISDYCREHNDEHIALISYNYDTMLESALESRFDVKFERLTDYFDTTKQPFILFKPHGSANWVKRLCRLQHVEGKICKVVQETKYGIERAIELNERVIALIANSRGNVQYLADHAKSLHSGKYNMSEILNSVFTDIVIANEEERLTSGSSLRMSDPYFPQLLIPHKDKDSFVMPRNHTDLLDRILPEVEEILIIGWKGQEALMQKKLGQFIGEKEVKITWIDAPSKDAEGKFLEINSANDPENKACIQTLRELMPNSIWTKKCMGFMGYAREMAARKAEFFK